MTIRGAKCSQCRLTFIGDLGQPFSCLSCGTRLKVYREKTRPLDAAGQSISCSLSVTIENTLPPLFLRGKNNSLFAGSCTGVPKVGEGGSVGDGGQAGTGGPKQLPRCDLCRRVLADDRWAALRVGRSVVLACGACRAVVGVVPRSSGTLWGGHRLDAWAHKVPKGSGGGDGA